MNRIGCVCVMMLVLIVPIRVAAQEEGKEQGGFFGNIILGGGMAAARPSQLEVTDDNETINALDEQADNLSDAIPFVMAEIGYANVSTGTDFSFGTQSDRNCNFALKIKQSLDSLGSLQIVLGHGYGKVWQDPYLVGIKRSETDETTTSIELDYENIVRTGARLSIRGARINIDSDLIGIREPDLKRDGTVLALGAGYAIVLNEKNVIVPGIEFEVNDRDGESNSSKSVRLLLEHVLSMGKFAFKTNLVFSETEFDKTHPVFNRTREEKGYTLSEFITYREPFGWRKISFNGLIAYSQVDADIGFFESDVLVIGLGVGYSF